MKALGNYLKDTIEKNPHTFRIFSPDELTSNKVRSHPSLRLRLLTGSVRSSTLCST